MEMRILWLVVISCLGLEGIAHAARCSNNPCLRGQFPWLRANGGVNPRPRSSLVTAPREADSRPPSQLSHPRKAIGMAPPTAFRLSRLLLGRHGMFSQLWVHE